MMSRILTVALASSLSVVNAIPAHAQGYPSKPIRIYTSAAGTQVDFMARLIAQGITVPLGQPVVVDNRAPVVAAETVSKAPPDGYTLYLTGSNFWIGPLLQRMSYDPVRDFAPIAITNRQPNLLVVHPALPVKSVADLIALAKARPGQLNYAGGSTGSTTHLAAELFKSMAGVNITHISYKVATMAFNDVVTGQVQVYFALASSVATYVKSGRLRALAVTSATPSALFPELPTIAASGVPGYDVVGISGVFAPARTPAAIIGRLNQEILQSLAKPDVKEKVQNAGQEIVGSTPEQFAAAVKTEMAAMAKIIKETGIQSD